MRHQIDVTFKGIETTSPIPPQYDAVATVERDSDGDWMLESVWIRNKAITGQMAQWQIKQVEDCVEQYFAEKDYEASQVDNESDGNNLIFVEQ